MWNIDSMTSPKYPTKNLYQKNNPNYVLQLRLSKCNSKSSFKIIIKITMNKKIAKITKIIFYENF